MTFSIPSTVLNATGDNILLVVMDNTGHDETTGALNPRGILLAETTGGTILSWKIAGTAGGEANIDPVRGPLSQGGLTSERLGWHLPGFDATTWPSLSPADGTSAAGVQFYRTTTNLSIPAGIDVSIMFSLSVPSNSTSQVRSLLWVNGYNYGLFNPIVGNQVVFPVPTGILNLNGENTIAISIWNQDGGPQTAAVEVGWQVAYVHASGYDFTFDASALRPGWDASREVYA
jgi:beta-galactosidase GanA